MFYGVTAACKCVVALGVFVLPMLAALAWQQGRSPKTAPPGAAQMPRRASWGSVGPGAGFAQLAADRLKAAFKALPPVIASDVRLMRLAPVVGWVVPVLLLAFVPLGPDVYTGFDPPYDVLVLQLVRVDAGLLLAMALNTVGLFVGPLAQLGASGRVGLSACLRQWAQKLSWAVALQLSMVGPALAGGATELAALVHQQSGAALAGLVPRWGVFTQPLAALVCWVAIMGQTEQLPMDALEAAPQGRSASGRDALVPAELMLQLALSALFVAVFLGGWQLPWSAAQRPNPLQNAWLRGAGGMVVFAIKILGVSVLQRQVCASMPRLRHGQAMQLCFGGLVPLAVLNIVVTAQAVWYDPDHDILAGIGCALWAVLGLISAMRPPQTSRAVWSAGEAAAD
jgi:NADH-quinone oxidoreductase subunit H